MPICQRSNTPSRPPVHEPTSRCPVSWPRKARGSFLTVPRLGATRRTCPTLHNAGRPPRRSIVRQLSISNSHAATSCSLFAEMTMPASLHEHQANLAAPCTGERETTRSEAGRLGHRRSPLVWRQLRGCRKGSSLWSVLRGSTDDEVGGNEGVHHVVDAVRERAIPPFDVVCCCDTGIDHRFACRPRGRPNAATRRWHHVLGVAPHPTRSRRRGGSSPSSGRWRGTRSRSRSTRSRRGGYVSCATSTNATMPATGNGDGHRERAPGRRLCY